MTSSADAPSGNSTDEFRNQGIRSLLEYFSHGDPEQQLTIREILSALQQGGFGVFLFVAILPSFIPIPGVGGAVSGPLTILIGLQLLCGLQQPWLPGFIARRGPRRSTTARFMRRIGGLLRWLDKLLKPRLPLLVKPLPARMLSGILLICTGLLLALPIPFTNYLFAVILLLFALALIEHDGLLMTLCWIAATICIVLFGVTSDQLISLIQGWLAKF